MTAPRTTVEMKRVTLWRCTGCNAIYLYDQACNRHEDWCPHHEPIEFAPLPSEETRYWLKKAAESGIGCRTCDWTHESEKKIAAALAEIEEVWKP